MYFILIYFYSNPISIYFNLIFIYLFYFNPIYLFYFILFIFKKDSQTRPWT